MTRLLWCTLSLLTHTHSATLFSTNWATLQTPLPVYVGSRSTQTTHSKTRVSYTVLIKDCPQVPLHVSNALWSCLLCRQTLRGAPWAINTHWQNIRTNEYLGGIEELFMSACKKKKKSLNAHTECIMIETPNNDEAMQSRQQPFDIPQVCDVGQGAIWDSQCLFLLTSLRVTYITHDTCIMLL